LHRKTVALENVNITLVRGKTHRLQLYQVLQHNAIGWGFIPLPEGIWMAASAPSRRKQLKIPKMRVLALALPQTQSSLWPIGHFPSFNPPDSSE